MLGSSGSLGVRVHVAAQGLTCRFAEAGENLQHALRDARFRREFGHTQHGEGRLLGRLPDHRIAGGERGAELP